MRAATALLLALAAAAPTPSPAAEAVDPWRALETLRARLAADGHLEADFRQSYVPAGFELGDTESGAIALAMPDCLRWEYREPYRKSFLVCGSRAWSWVEGEPVGQRFTIEGEREMGLDLLLLPASELARRYRAAATRGAEGIELVLEPLDPAAELAVANLGLDREGARPLSLDWRDREGNVTSFRFERWRALETDAAFAPPSELDWSDPAVESGR
jgi:outer membrane lipoprotein carrier protein